MPQVVVIPLQMNSCKKLTFFVNCDRIILFDCVDEMLRILFSNHFDSEVVDDESKCDWPGVVFPQAWGELTWVVSMERQPFGEELVGQQADLS